MLSSAITLFTFAYLAASAPSPPDGFPKPDSSKSHPVPSGSSHSSSSDSTCPVPAGKSSTVHVGDNLVPLSNKGDEFDIKVRYIGKGSFGCVYDVRKSTVTEGTITIPSPAVAKTPRLDGTGAFDATEITALTEIQELYAYGTDDNQRNWAILKKHDGKMVTDTTAFKKRFPKGYSTDDSEAGFENCAEFMMAIYATVLDKMGWYAETYGWHPNDMNWNNFLFSDDLKTVNIIDWGNAVQVSKDPDDVLALGKAWFEDFQFQSQLPLWDTENRYQNAQGICQSDMRDNGEPYVNIIPGA